MKLKALWKSIWQEKKYKVVFIISIILAAFIIGGAIAARSIPQKKPVQTDSSSQPEPVKYTSPLDGLEYDNKDLANRHPLAVIVENHPSARPQFGLIDASIVYEAITEGGITRFMAIFGPTNTKEIGPIRSARLFFMDWLKEFDAFFAHAGGNEDALANIGTYAIKDIPHSNAYYWRDYKGRNVASEHTLYSSTEKLYEYASDKKYDINSSNYEKYKFKKDGPPAIEGGKGVEINFSSPSFKVIWNYDAATNSYSRSMAGSEHKDAASGETIKAKNIIVQTVSRTLQPHGSYGNQNWVFDTIGSGNAKIYRDGKEINATWKKTELISRTKFYDESGSEIEFNPGKTWIEVVPPEVSPATI